MEPIGKKHTDTKEEEIWKVLRLGNIQHRYLISNHGRVFDEKKLRYLNLNDNGGGYFTVGLMGPKSKAHVKYIHRLVAHVFLDNFEFKPQVGHKDHNKSNNHCSNLYWTTQKQNTNDGIKAGRINSKKRGKTNQLVESDYEKIATLRKQGFGVNEIAVQLGFPRTTISSVINGRSNWTIFQKYMTM